MIFDKNIEVNNPCKPPTNVTEQCSRQMRSATAIESEKKDGGFASAGNDSDILEFDCLLIRRNFTLTIRKNR